MADQRSEWQTKELAAAFLQGVRGAMPGADQQMAVLAKVSERWCPQPSRVLDLGCGDGILGRFLLEMYPAARAVFTDFSEPMLDAARNKLGVPPRATVVKSDFSTPEWLEAVRPHAPYDIVVSGFAIHHQPDVRKQALYAEIYSLLSQGGFFLNFEHVASATPAGQELFDDFFIDNLFRFHRAGDPDRTRQEIEQTYYSRPDKKENILASVEAQCQWLREIGFLDVDCFWKLFELAVFGGRKRPQRTR